MQVLVIIVQNAVLYSELGVATSAATFFRSIGVRSERRSRRDLFQRGCLDVKRHLHGTAIPRGFALANVTPASGRLPAAVHVGIKPEGAEAISTVFAIAVPIAALAAFTWLIPQRAQGGNFNRPCDDSRRLNTCREP